MHQIRYLRRICRMNKAKECTFKCRKISGGKAEGPLLISKGRVCFYFAEPESGKIMEKDHDLEGKSIAGKVVVMPSGKGSSVVQADGLYKLSKSNNSPRALIVREADTVLVSTAIILEIPMVFKVEEDFYRKIKEGNHVILDADAGLITLEVDGA